MKYILPVFKKLHLSILFLACLVSTYGQDKLDFKQTFQEAEYFFMTEDFVEAVFYYNELLKIDPLNSNLHFLVGACYLSLYGQKKEAVPHLEEAVTNISAGYREGSYKERLAPRETMFALARAYHIDYQLDKAIDFYEKYRNVMLKRNFADIEYVNKQIKSCELAQSMIKKPVEVEFTDIGNEINKYPSNYNPVFSGNDSLIIYMAEMPLEEGILMSKKGRGGWSEPFVIDRDLGTEGDCYPVSLSFNGKELYLVKTDHFESDIYVSYFKNGKWSTIQKLNRNINTDYYESHACISMDGKKLYFTSDRPGGQGALDIWVSEKESDGDWGPAVNLGPKINSFYNEETPFIIPNGRKLFFSSQGHATMGGYDIFSVSKLPDGTWSNPENIGYPINTTDDDLFYVPRKSGSSGYFSTILESDPEKRKIYALNIGPVGELQIGARQTEEKLPDSLSVEEIKPGVEGVKPGEEAEEKVREIPPDEYYVLNSIMFGFDESNLDEEALHEADRVVEVMKRYPEITVELTGHSDAKGTNEYNIRLSKRRAESVAEYLIMKGIDPGRIKTFGIGEGLPIAINEYEDGTDSPAGRRLNRHVSIKFLNLQNENVQVSDIFVPDALRPKNDLTFSVLLVNSDAMLDNLPDSVSGESIALIITDHAFLYTAGNFDRKADAMRFLNEVIDQGFPEAMMMEEKELQQLVRDLSEGDLPMEISFTIQIMALKNPVDVSYFKNLENVSRFVGNDGLYRYVYGEFRSIDEAFEKLPEIRKLGYHDAFIMYLARYRKM